jgi:hypothetical protein
VNRHRDEGAVIVWVMVCMTALLGVGALVLDMGSLYVERRELQNGADSAALSVAQECAKNVTCASGASAPAALAQTAADSNAKDGTSTVDQLCGPAGSGLAACSGGKPASVPATATSWVRVDTSTRTASGGSSISLGLSKFLGISNGSARASAVSAFGPLGSAATLPYIICQNQWLLATNQGNTFPSAPIIVYSKDSGKGQQQAADCPTFSGGGTAPGNFSWLDVSDNANCRTELLVAGGLVTGVADTGNNNQLKSPCTLDETGANSLLGKTVVIPLFNTTNGQSGNNLRYNVVGFAGFTITGYRLGAGWNQTSATQCPAGAPNGGNLRFFCGQFVKLVTNEGGFGGTNFGVSIVKMVG